jgi:hypothetical protein
MLNGALRFAFLAERAGRSPFVLMFGANTCAIGQVRLRQLEDKKSAISYVSRRSQPNNKTNNIQRHPSISMTANSL